MTHNSQVLNSALSTLSDKYLDDTPKPDIIYQYTNWNGLKGILESSSLLFTHYAHLNDPQELIYAKKELNQAIRDYSTNHIFWENFLTKLPHIIDAYNVYICSFCKKPDYLPAWRWYGDNGKGFAIGFKKEYFLDESIRTTKSQLHPIRYDIAYGIDTSKEFLEKMVRKTEEIYHTLGSPTKNGDIYTTLMHHFLSHLPSIKHPAYQEEHEFRLCIVEEDKDNFQKLRIKPTGKNSLDPTEKFSTKRVPECLLNYPLELIKEQLPTQIPRTTVSFRAEHIAEIWVGPRCNPNLDIVKKIMRDNIANFERYEDMIKISQQPYT